MSEIIEVEINEPRVESGEEEKEKSGDEAEINDTRVVSGEKEKEKSLREKENLKRIPHDQSLNWGSIPGS